MHLTSSFVNRANAHLVSLGVHTVAEPSVPHAVGRYVLERFCYDVLIVVGSKAEVMDAVHRLRQLERDLAVSSSSVIGVTDTLPGGKGECDGSQGERERDTVPGITSDAMVREAERDAGVFLIRRRCFEAMLVKQLKRAHKWNILKETQRRTGAPTTGSNSTRGGSEKVSRDVSVQDGLGIVSGSVSRAASFDSTLPTGPIGTIGTIGSGGGGAKKRVRGSVTMEGERDGDSETGAHLLDKLWDYHM
ncbi:hypothetical protein KIPB_002316 [Kipferlia bialata]|uniref:Uncharacterized protein n=1 Tax=Kipferlia bialata TaxID=797122 RepID=A0A9K3CS06_9EUKA|nr:hypothetical protein KIPB_002316 [Kipferlia bialata]|eukprot:g2316.t1